MSCSLGQARSLHAIHQAKLHMTANRLGLRRAKRDEIILPDANKNCTNLEATLLGNGIAVVIALMSNPQELEKIPKIRIKKSRLGPKKQKQ